MAFMWLFSAVFIDFLQLDFARLQIFLFLQPRGTQPWETYSSLAQLVRASDC